MDSKKPARSISSFLASLIIVLRRFIRLIFTPYKTMRSISLEADNVQLYILFFLVFLYFLLVGLGKATTFIVLFGSTLFLIYTAGRVLGKNVQLKSILFTFGYALIPTLIWFFSSYALYHLLPPPRTSSVLGKAFSVFYVSFSLSLLLWKLILTYLAIRFSLKLRFYPAIFTLILYAICILTLSYFGYILNLAKVPFV